MWICIVLFDWLLGDLGCGYAGWWFDFIRTIAVGNDPHVTDLSHTTPQSLQHPTIKYNRIKFRTGILQKIPSSSDLIHA